MQIKTFRAESLQDALLMVKKDLGDDAVILSTGTTQEHRRYGFAGKKLIEVTTYLTVLCQNYKEREQYIRRT